MESEFPNSNFKFQLLESKRPLEMIQNSAKGSFDPGDIKQEHKDQ